jgi:hypothetical protein
MAQGRQLGWGPIAAGALLVANVVVPLVWGDVYPFTSAPMFRDSPRACYNYRVYGPDGAELDSAAWLCQRVYDGNPVGYGVGIQPPAVIEHDFGRVHGEEQVRDHFQRLLSRPEHADLPYIHVEEEQIGPLPQDPERVGIVRTKRWTIMRPYDGQL